MLQFIAQYWLGILFGLIVTAIGIFHKRLKLWYDAYQEKKQQKFRDSIVSDIRPMFEEMAHRSDENDKVMQQQIEDLRAGLLSVQSHTFKASCRKYLQANEAISLEQFELLGQDHDAYNGLGGNHDGDQLFALVQKKFENSLK